MTYVPPPIMGIGTTVSALAAHDTPGSILCTNSITTQAYPLANLALFVPFSVSHPCTAYEGWIETGGTATGNFDIGIYDAAGSRLTSSGSTASAASTVVNTTTMANQTLLPGKRYYMAFAEDTNTDTFFCTAMAAGIYEASVILEATTAFVLPASPTLSRTTRAFVPHFGLNLYTVSF